MASRYHFNLLVKKQRALDAQILGFFNKYIRYMLIITQLVVLAVFLSKILLDQKIVDLKESIDQKNEIIKTAQPMISANNRLASQVKLLSDLVEKQKVAGTLVMTVPDNVPESVNLESVQYAKNECVVKGVTYRPLDIKKFEARLKKKFPSAVVSLNSISIEARRYVFEIAITDGKKRKLQDYSTIAIALIFISFFLLFAIRPSLGLILSLMQEMQTYTILNKKLDDKIQEIITAQNTYARVVEKQTTINGTLPSSYQLADTKPLISSTSAKLIDFSIKKTTVVPIPVGALTTIDVSSQIQGPWKTIKNYIVATRQQPRLFLLDSITMERPESTNSGDINATLQLKTFMYRSP